MYVKISVLVGLVAAVLIGCSQQPPEASEGDELPASADQLLAACEALRSHLANVQEAST